MLSASDNLIFAVLLAFAARNEWKEKDWLLAAAYAVMTIVMFVQAVCGFLAET